MKLCNECDGKGWYEVTKSGHHPACDCGEVGGYLCPIPIQEQEQCANCFGKGYIEEEENNETKYIQTEEEYNKVIERIKYLIALPVFDRYDYVEYHSSIWRAEQYEDMHNTEETD